MADEYGSDFITIADEDGKEYELEVLTTVEYNGASYLAVVPADADEGEGLEVSILRSTDEDGGSQNADLQAFRTVSLFCVRSRTRPSFRRYTT